MRRLLKSLLDVLRENQRIQRDSAAWEILRPIDDGRS